MQPSLAPGVTNVTGYAFCVTGTWAGPHNMGRDRRELWTSPQASATFPEIVLHTGEKVKEAL